MSKKGRHSLPIEVMKANGFSYNVIQSDYKSENHGETCKDNKQIMVSPQDNIEVLIDTIVHEGNHALVEDIFESIDSIEKVDEKEEQWNRLFTPRLVAWICENKEWIKWIWKKKKS